VSPVFDDLFGTPRQPPTEQVSVVGLRARVAELEQANERVKSEARELIDVAYNRALQDMADACGTNEARAAAVKLRRQVRKA
jgi:hypothetical protein